MRRNRLLGFSLVGLFAFLLGQGVASAQGGADPAEPGKTVQISPQQQQSEAAQVLARMESIRSTVNRQLQEARAENDVVKTLCLNDKLNQLDVAIKKVTERKRSLDLAVSRGEHEVSDHEFVIIRVLGQRGEQIDAEAKQCIGKEVGFVGESSTSVDVDENLPDEDSTDYKPPAIISVGPTCASCFR